MDGGQTGDMDLGGFWSRREQEGTMYQGEMRLLL
jgi:hypothetical protein